MRDHVEKAWMHGRLAEALQVQFAQRGKLLDQAREGLEGHERERAVRLATALGAGATVSEIAPRWWGRYPFDRRDVALRISVRVADLHAAVYALRDAAGAPVPVRGSASELA